MKQVLPVLRMSLCLASLTASILFIALGLGLVPDRQGAILRGRKALCESIAIQCSLAAQRKDLTAVKFTVPQTVARNPEILSAAVRSADGTLLLEIGDHDNNWNPDAGEHAITTQMEVPIALKDRPWGTVELRFEPLPPTGFDAPLQNPVLRLVLFVLAAGFLAYSVYLGTIFRKLGLGNSGAVPQRIRATMDTLAEGVLILDDDQRIALANEAFAKLVGKTPGELEGQLASELPWKAQAGQAPKALPWAEATASGATRLGSMLALQTDTARLQTLSVNSTPILGDDGVPRGALATFDNLTQIEKKNAHLRKLLQKLTQSRTEIRRQNEELRLLATKDPLTLCLNRRSFFVEFETHWSAAARYDTPLSCVMVDIDRFKSINDRFGHGTGDQVLQHVAELLKGMVRKSDSVCRYGGEEFCILLPHTDLDKAYEAAERYRWEIETRNFSNLGVTASFGVSALGLGARDPRELIEQADKALYAAKHGGRNRVKRWDEIGDEAAAPKPARNEPPAPAEAVVPIPFHAVTALVSALAYRHGDTAEHSRRVADLAVATAAGLMSHSESYVLEVAALLHDIGKLGVPDAVLLKPGPLTPEEWTTIRTHEMIGQEIISASFTSASLCSIIRNHHAYFGGSAHDPGLPRGEDIPLGARILAIADAYDAMVSDRVYRKGRSREEAFAELKRCAAVQFDPALVERFISVVLGRDAHAHTPALFLNKQTALRIGIQIEKVANALDTQDNAILSIRAGNLKATASEHGITPIAAIAGRLEKAAAENADRAELTELTIDLLDLCRSTYHSYLPQPDGTGQPELVS